MVDEPNNPKAQALMVWGGVALIVIIAIVVLTVS